MSKNNSSYLYFNEKKLKPQLDSLYVCKQIPCLLSSHLLNVIFHQDNFQRQTATSMPHGTSSLTWPTTVCLETKQVLTQKNTKPCHGDRDAYPCIASIFKNISSFLTRYGRQDRSGKGVLTHFLMKHFFLCAFGAPLPTGLPLRPARCPTHDWMDIVPLHV